MTSRIDYFRVSPKAIQAMMQLQKYVNGSSLEHSLLSLVKMRASQINGCAYCIDMHSKDARAAGETEQRLYALDAWRETSFYSARERAALEWTEALTLVHEGHVPDYIYGCTRALQRSGARGPVARHRRHQRLEPCVDRVPGGSGQLPGPRQCCSRSCIRLALQA